MAEGECIWDWTFEATERTNEWLRNHEEIKRRLMMATSFMLDFL